MTITPSFTTPGRRQTWDRLFEDVPVLDWLVCMAADVVDQLRGGGLNIGPLSIKTSAAMHQAMRAAFEVGRDYERSQMRPVRGTTVKPPRRLRLAPTQDHE